MNDLRGSLKSSAHSGMRRKTRKYEFTCLLHAESSQRVNMPAQQSGASSTGSAHLSEQDSNERYCMILLCVHPHIFAHSPNVV